jgi:hypothetical protein
MPKTIPFDSKPYMKIISRTIGKTLAIINVPMLRALVTEVLRPSKQQNITHLVKDAVRLFEIYDIIDISKTYDITLTSSIIMIIIKAG